MFYVEAEPWAGKTELLKRAQFFESHGYDNVEFFNGGWMDRSVNYVRPHYLFNNEQDAIAYALTAGKVVLLSPPVRDI